MLYSSFPDLALHLCILAPTPPIVSYMQVMRHIGAASETLKQQPYQGLRKSPGAQSWLTWKQSLRVNTPSVTTDIPYDCLSIDILQ